MPEKRISNMFDPFTVVYSICLIVVAIVFAAALDNEF